MFYFYFTEYDVTIIDAVKDNAITDAYLKIFETLYRSGKINGYVFRQKEPVAADHLPIVTTSTVTAGVQFCSSDVRYRSRPLEGYQVIFEGPAAKDESFKTSAESEDAFLIEKDKKKVEMEEKKRFLFVGVYYIVRNHHHLLMYFFFTFIDFNQRMISVLKHVLTILTQIGMLTNFIQRSSLRLRVLL
jgi:hypothetical protein